MLLPILQSAAPAAEAFSADTLVTKGAQLVETLKSTPADELVASSASALARFGLKVLLAVAIYIVGAWLIRKTKKVIAKGFAKRKSDPTIASFIQSLVTVTLWVVLILAMVGTLGINTTSIAALLAAGGMAIGMAMSGTVQNFAGGLMLLAFKPFKVGDYVSTQGYFGWISEINIVHTKLITTDNREITIPNGALSSGNIDNYSSRNPYRLSVWFSVAYGTDLDMLRDVLLELVKQQPEIMDARTPGAADPRVYVNKLGENGIEVEIRVWIKSEYYKWMQTWLNENIYKELPKHGIRFPFPQLDVHMKTGD
jgi:small conductance mechanosensitive channel